jgi:hypothetical protein
MGMSLLSSICVMAGNDYDNRYQPPIRYTRPASVSRGDWAKVRRGRLFWKSRALQRVF